MKTYKQFMNENIKSLLTGKSMDSVVKELETLSDEEKVIAIIKYQLPFDLLPRDKNGRCIVWWDLIIDDCGISKLPDNLTVHNDLDVNDNELTELPKGLIVHNDLFCFGNKVPLKKPDDAIIGGRFLSDYR